jgi:hypothetical protein
VCLGDMNIDLNKEQDRTYPQWKLLTHLLSTLSEYGLKNIMLGNTYLATRLRGDGTLIQSALDHLYISEEEKILEARVLDKAMSDHMPILVEIGKKKTCRNRSSLRIRSFRNFNLEDFNLDLAFQPWESILEATDVDQMVEYFNTFTSNVLDRHAPFRDIMMGAKRNNIPLSEACVKEMKERPPTKESWGSRPAGES